MATATKTQRRRGEAATDILGLCMEWHKIDRTHGVPDDEMNRLVHRRYEVEGMLAGARSRTAAEARSKAGIARAIVEDSSRGSLTDNERRLILSALDDLDDLDELL